MRKLDYREKKTRIYGISCSYYLLFIVILHHLCLHSNSPDVYLYPSEGSDVYRRRSRNFYGAELFLWRPSKVERVNTNGDRYRCNQCISSAWGKKDNSRCFTCSTVNWHPVYSQSHWWSALFIALYVFYVYIFL